MPSSYSAQNVIIVGCGFLGEAAAQLFSSYGHPTLGIVRTIATREKIIASPNAKAALNRLQIACCDVTDSRSVHALTPQIASDALLIYAVSSGRGGPEAYATIYRDSLKRIIDAWKPQQTIFVSSTSVYAQKDGEKVTESSPVFPERETGRILLEAEAIALSTGGIVARLAGIYGPGRSVLLKKFLTGEARLEEGGHRWINQIHCDDGARALFHLGKLPITREIFNVVDNTPATQRQVYQWMVDYYAKPLPPIGPADLNRKRGWTSKRVSNDKLCATGWSPHYPSYREALPEFV